MQAELAKFLSDTFGVDVAVGAKGLEFSEKQPAVLRAALSNVIEAFKYYSALRDVFEGGSARYRVLTRSEGFDAWTTAFESDVCNDCIMQAAKVSKDPAVGTVQVYDALMNNEILNFPAGGF